MLFSVHETCRYPCIGRTLLYRLIGAGELDVVRIGNRTLIPRESVEALIERRRANRSRA